MGLYQGLNRPRAEAPPARPLASMRALRVSLRSEAPSKESWAVRRMEAVDSGASPVPRRKGLIRLLLVGGLGVWALAAMKPWRTDRAWLSELSPLFQLKGPTPPEAPAAADRKARSALEAALAALPVVPGGGKPLALYQDGAGRWWRVNGEGVLSPTSSPAAPGNLGLPELRGLAAHSRARRGGRELVLEAGEGLLEACLPLEDAVASEVRAVDLRVQSSVRLITHDGASAELGAGELKRKQRRLALVLADLAAKKRRAADVDLRFEGAAVVRLASR